ncbi:MAG: hypothetical protein CMJ48_13160 [Planctomycetaceae bacterium]|nr:hypothetical protein [Planctomycetaceae bacterium]
MRTLNCRVLIVTLLGLATTLTATGQALAADADPEVAFLVGNASPETWGPETKAAYDLLQKLGTTRVIVPAAKGKFVDSAGNDVDPQQFRVVWIHAGDSIKQTNVLKSKSIAALRKLVSEGRGLLLSGAALALVERLGIEQAHPRVGGPGNDRSEAALVPIETKHPVFANLKLEGSVARISDAGHPAFADFHGTGGPADGMLLARTPGGSEHPLVEYEVGKGRVIAMGWRLPHYANAKNAHRANLERLTENLLAYLGDSKRWQKVEIKHTVRLAGQRTEPGVPEDEWQALERGVRDLAASFPREYTRGAEFLTQLKALKAAHDEAIGKGDKLDAGAKFRLEEIVETFEELHRDALLANPLLNFEELLLVKRGSSSPKLGLPMNWQGNCSLPKSGFDDEVAVLSPVRPEGELRVVHHPEEGRFVGDVELHFDGEKLLFSSVGSHDRWQVFEVNIDGTGLRQVTVGAEPDIDSYDACYLPSGDIIFSSTAGFCGVPCVKGSDHVANLYLMDEHGKNVRQLTFDQDHDWCPTLLPNGRVLYLRWEYSDIPHFASRILFHMNPDGTEQMEYYGSNSYWPNSMFFARPIPGKPTQFAAVISGHHDVPRMGELVLFDSAKGRHEADGVVQRIPGFGQKVEPVLRDGLVKASWPKFLHPWPLSDKYFIVSAQKGPNANWGIYLVDVFDNMTLLKETPGYAMLEPIPLRKTQRPPVVPNRVREEQSDAVVYIEDIYAGPGLEGIPRGTVENLRLFTYHFAYHGMGGQVNRVGLDGPWDIKRIMGSVPVEADGSVRFRIPANTPISVQPLDDEGQALQLMRSWFVGMPGEQVSCVGCHERQDRAPGNRSTDALARSVSEIAPWYGRERGFSFKREVQPVLDQHCVGCHNGQPSPDGTALADLRAHPPVRAGSPSAGYNNGSLFSPSYLELRRFVRAPTIESDMHLLPPMDFHADTTRLMQMLRKGHHAVELDHEAWDRLVTWIDLHAPAHGTWHEIVGEKLVASQRERRRLMTKRYAGRDADPEAIHATITNTKPTAPPTLAAVYTRSTQKPPRVAGWPFDAKQAQRLQHAEQAESRQTVTLGEDIALDLMRIPAGEFVMGSADGHPDERPMHAVRIEKPFWMGRFEVTNEQFAQFNAEHDSRLEHGDFLQFSHQERGYLLNQPTQPVVRVSQHQATAFCRWLSEKTGRTFRLPSEAEWEYACRAGTAGALSFGGLQDDFSKHANVADVNLKRVDNFRPWSLPVGAIPTWRPADDRFDDAFRVSAPVGTYAPNPWGLCDMHGNVAEWTTTSYAPYPKAGASSVASDNDRAVVRGGSWYDRPKHCRSAFRQSYRPFQRIYDVGFRVVCEN